MVRTVASVCAAALLLAACTGGDEPPAGDHVDVVATLYPAAYLAERVGGERVDVTEIAPPGVEPHDLELSAGQVRDLGDADVVVYAGGGFQPAVDEAVADLDDQRRFDILGGHTLRTGDGSGGDTDPHVWLNLRTMRIIAADLATRLADLDPDNAEAYFANADELAMELGELDRAFEEGLRDCERREIVVSHEAFGYLAERYGLEEVAFAGLDPEAEPSPARLAEITEFARERGVTTIFYEELTSPAAAETLADELGIETRVLSPLETRPDDGDYLSAMRTNLTNLRAALGCD